MSKKLTQAQREILKYIRGYPDWEAEINMVADMRQAITYDKDPVQTSPEGDKLIEMIIRMDELYDRVSKVEASLHAVFLQDERIWDARSHFCYGKPTLMTDYELRKYRKMLANNLLRMFGDNWKEQAGWRE